MKILIAYDGSVYSYAAIEDLRRAGLPSEADALVVSVAHDSTASQMTSADALASDAANRIQSYFPHWTVSCQVLWGSPAKAILQRCASWRPDLLIVGSHGRSAASRLFLGSVSLELIHHAPCSVRVVRLDRRGGEGPIRIIVGHDGSLQAEGAVREITRRSWPKSTEVNVVSVVAALVPATVSALEVSTYANEPAFKVIEEADAHEWARLQYVAQDSARLLRQAGLAANATVVAAEPAKELIAAAARSNADAIFVGDRGIGRIERLLLGSVSTAVATHAGCTVEIVRS
jgi:nucleotide-binding universal stress UspA family protein